MDRLRAAYQGMCRAMSGGWVAMAAAMAVTKDSLENRVYERRGQSVGVHEAMQMQSFSGTKLFAEAVALESGGVFVAVPEVARLSDKEIKSVYMQLVAEVGELSREWQEAVKDGRVDRDERKRLTAIRDAICARVTQVNEMTFAAYCPD
ncbi:YmfL family putative regulatory protein [Chromobacterium vaccinii]|uniref:YmfL family putative regulatory protein n=1 Tax=Chromobacterium vaccinii TaxID=1108595 RepID=UPI000E161992|nr:YmfL family putative regulatory protein [Chromobacterium vaccinii]SUX30697.1 Uncharacterised protein [Chromobacterium vaccinii]